MVLLLVLTAFAASSAAQPRGSAATPEARLVRALSLLETRRGSEALDELREIAAERPEWATAGLALGSTLLRRGLFAEAAEEYTRAIGTESAAAIENGDEIQIDLAPETLDALLGLAICRDEEGAVRRADRLYRAYADRMGLASPDAARAFYRLATMLERTDVPWGDPAAERARALALDPGIETSDTLPPLPDPASDPVTEPYTRAIALVDTEPDESDLASAPDDSGTTQLAPPVLLRYVEPRLARAGGDSLTAGATLDVELLVNSEGAVADVRIVECDRVDCDVLTGVVFAASHWLFEPAMRGDQPVPARVLFPVPTGEGPPGAAAGEEP